MKGKLSNNLSGVSRPSPAVSAAVRAWLLYEPVAADVSPRTLKIFGTDSRPRLQFMVPRRGQPTTTPRKRRSGRVIDWALMPDNTYRYY